MLPPDDPQDLEEYVQQSIIEYKLAYVEFLRSLTEIDERFLQTSRVYQWFYRIYIVLLGGVSLALILEDNWFALVLIAPLVLAIAGVRDIARTVDRLKTELSERETEIEEIEREIHG